MQHADGGAASFRTPVLDRMASHEVFDRAMAWCNKCKCAKQRPDWHASRLIDLKNLKTKIRIANAQTVELTGQAGDTLDNVTIRIVEKISDRRNFPRAGDPANWERKKPEDAPEYGDDKNYDNRHVTLSHCWGPHGRRPMVLDSESKGRLTSKDGVKLGELPKTYKEAIIFAARIEHVGWIWIDSLCIIQNDTDDWTHESSDMQRVYRESFLNISATASSNSEEVAKAVCAILINRQVLA